MITFQVVKNLPTVKQNIATEEVLAHLPEIQQIKIGLLHLFIKHTSASLTFNENADPTVRQDFENYFNRTVKENEPYYKHQLFSVKN